MRLYSILLLTFFTAFSALAAPTDLHKEGKETAPASIYLFTSFSCPHCTAFHEKVLPSLQSEFVKPGQAKLIFVDMPYDARAMMGTMLSRCMPDKNVAKFSKVMFENQKTWGSATDPRAVITGYAKLLDMSETDINTCLADKELQRTIMQQRDNLAGLYGVRGMPSVVVVKDGKNKLFTGTDKDVIVSGIKKELEKK